MAERLQSHTEAIARADRLLPPDRRTPNDALWRQVYELCLVHYVIGHVLCQPDDVTRPFWADQDGNVTLVDAEDRDGKPGAVPVVCRRFSDEGLVRCLDQLDVLARIDPVGGRMARDAELRQLGTELADGSLFAALRAAPGEAARPIEQHARMLLGGVLDLLERGREAPSAAAT